MKKKSNLFSHYILGIVLLCSFLSCQSDTVERAALSMDCLYNKMAEIESHQVDSRFGDVDSTYPYSSAVDLEFALKEIQYAVSLANADLFTLQYEIDNYCIAADKALSSFDDSYQITLAPGTPAELKVFGVDRKGRIEFGENAAYGGGQAFTVESWLKYDEGFFESAIGDFIATFNNVADPHEGWMINFLGGNMRSTIGMGPQSSRVLEFGGVYPKNYGEWNHIAMVYDETLAEGQLKMYVNGEQFFSKSNDIVDDEGVVQSYQPNVEDLRMWAFQEPTDLSRCMTGYMKKFRMWSEAKNSEQLLELMATDVVGDEDLLICAWDFTVVPEDISNVPDKTGRCFAKIVGKHKWFSTNTQD